MRNPDSYKLCPGANANSLHEFNAYEITRDLNDNSVVADLSFSKKEHDVRGLLPLGRFLIPDYSALCTVNFLNHKANILSRILFTDSTFSVSVEVHDKLACGEGECDIRSENPYIFLWLR